MPFDGVVLLSTCDKDVPAQLMAMATVNKPAIIVTGGTRLAGFYEGQTVACSTDTQRFEWNYKAGRHRRGRDERSRDERLLQHLRRVRRDGHGQQRAVHGRGAGHDPARHAPLSRPSTPSASTMAEATGIKIMELVEQGHQAARHHDPAAFENAIKVLMATGASTNLVIHLIAIARRAGVDLCLDDFDRLSKTDALYHQRQALRRR